MHICFLTNEYPKPGLANGGVGTFVKTIANALIKKGIKVSVVGLNNTKTNEVINEDGINIYRLAKSKWKTISFIDNSYRIHKKIKQINSISTINIVESPELGLAFIYKIKNIKYVIRLHGGHHFFAEAEKRRIDFWKGFQERISFYKADAFIAVSDFVKSHTEKYLSYNSKKVKTIRFPVEININPNNKIGIENEDFYILYVGTVCEKKGIKELIAAFNNVRKYFPQAYLNIFGRDWKFSSGNSYIDYLKNTFSANELININFKGPVPYYDLILEYEKSTICVFPSHMETQGLVVLEAMSFGKPVIFSKFGPGPETIADGYDGLLVNPYDIDDLSQKISVLLTDKIYRNYLGTNAQKTILSKYSFNNNLIENIEFYNSLI